METMLLVEVCPFPLRGFYSLFIHLLSTVDCLHHFCFTFSSWLPLFQFFIVSLPVSEMERQKTGALTVSLSEVSPASILPLLHHHHSDDTLSVWTETVSSFFSFSEL